MPLCSSFLIVTSLKRFDRGFMSWVSFDDSLRTRKKEFLFWLCVFVPVVYCATWERENFSHKSQINYVKKTICEANEWTEIKRRQCRMETICSFDFCLIVCVWLCVQERMWLTFSFQIGSNRTESVAPIISLRSATTPRTQSKTKRRAKTFLITEIHRLGSSLTIADAIYRIGGDYTFSSRRVDSNRFRIQINASNNCSTIF